MPKDNHEKIMGELGIINTLIQELIRRVNIQNGRVGKSEDNINDLKVKYQNISDNNDYAIKLVDGLMKNFNSFIDNEKIKFEKKSDWWATVKSNLLIYVTTLLIGAAIGTYLPILWIYIKQSLH